MTMAVSERKYVHMVETALCIFSYRMKRRAGEKSDSMLTCLADQLTVFFAVFLFFHFSLSFLFSHIYCLLSIFI